MNVQITKIHQLQRSITLRYVIAVSLIALLSIAAFISMNSVIKGMDKSSYIVNVSGKQRMLSQYIALDAYRLHWHFASTMSDSEIQFIKRRLEKNAEEMARANELLAKGELPDGTVLPLSKAVKDIYFGELNLRYRVQQYTALVKLLSVLDDPKQQSAVLRDINLRSEGLLIDLNFLVQQHQFEGEISLQSIKDMKIGLLVVTLIVLLLEVLFIFHPMVRRIVELSESNADVVNNLEHLVELRTLHLEKANKQLEQLANHDALTGLRNRLNMEEDIEKVIMGAAKNSAEYAVLMLDIDWFKKINDQYGHDVGDFVLVEVSQILRSVIREGDHVYRAGGEEFVVLLNRLSYADAKDKAEVIRKSVAAYLFKIGDIEIRLTISCGLYHSAIIDAVDVKTLLKMTDNALYQAKQSGRNYISEVSTLAE